MGSLMLLKSNMGKIHMEISIFESEVWQPLHFVATQPPKVVQMGMGFQAGS